MQKQIRELLFELNKTRTKFWNITPEVGLFLHELIRTNPKIKKILEIGTSNGVSAIWMGSALKEESQKLTNKNPSSATPTHQLYTIESHRKLRYHLATENLRNAGLLGNSKTQSKVTQILGHAPEAIPTTPAKFELIFLDATKYEHPEYLKTLLPRTRKGSIIITDNALSHKKELEPYHKIISKNPKFQTHLLPIGTGLLISIRTKA